MGISINPVQLFKIFKENRVEKNKKIALYLDKIADDAEKIAAIWQKNVETLINEDVVDVHNNEDFKKIDAWTLTMQRYNSRHYSRLVGYHENLSSVLGEKYKDDLDSIIWVIADLLNHRNITSKKALEYLSQRRQLKFVDRENVLDSLNDLEASVDLLNKEAAALRVRAETFKAKN